ncbi:MAG: phosphatase PAP2 family protein [Acholeplasmatales bacterium]|nr:phosphatase PAP2 family protein [Acholeplasmatales bacterium]
MSEKKKGLCISIVSLSLFIIMLILLLFVDKSDEVGLSGFNKLYSHDYNKALDIISDILFYIVILIFVASIIFFIYKLIKVKDVKKVDYRFYIYYLVAFLAVLIWILFDFVIKINNRPNVIDGQVESSFPSTHVFLTTYILLPLTTFFFKKDRERNPEKIDLDTIITVIAFVVIGAEFVLRFWSGMHWLTDCICGLLLGVFLFGLYYFLISLIKDKKSLD